MKKMDKPCPVTNFMLWFFLPGIVLAILVLAEMFFPDNYIGMMVAENGPIELVEFFILVVAVIMAMLCLRSEEVRGQKWLFAWYALAAIGCVYIAGEEISWGQQFFRWPTPDSWIIINDQHETNLHNTSSWLDQKPRILVEIGIIVGGLILPELMRFRPNNLPNWLKTITPPGKIAFTATLFSIVKIFDKIGKHSDFVLFKRGSELTELYIFYFILLYLLHMAWRYRRLSCSTQPAVTD